MFETLKYLIGAAGASGYGSKSTGEQVTENCGGLHSITAIITGGFIICLLFLKTGLQTTYGFKAISIFKILRAES